MSLQYVSVEEAIPRPGLRMVVVGKVPSPWGEAAKNIFQLKGIDFAAVRLVYDNAALKAWAGQLSGPIAILNDEPPRAGWQEILMLAEKLSAQPALLPVEPRARSMALALCEKLCAKDGLGTGGFGDRVAGYLGGKYGYDPARAEADAAAVHRLLAEFAGLLHAQRDNGSDYYLEDLSAVDIYSAAFMALFHPLPQEQCEMIPAVRTAFAWLDEDTARALDPILLEHRDMMYSRHLQLPLSL
jgi:hypothetical protein